MQSKISKIYNLWGSSFFSKRSKHNLNFKNAVKHFENVFCVLDNCIWIDSIKIAPIEKRILVIDSQCVSKHCWDFAYNSERLYLFRLPTQRSIIIAKVVIFRFQQCLGPFTMSLIEGYSETRLSRHLSNHVFHSL